jgi:hypothetical protein
MFLLSVAEFGLWAVLCFLFFGKKLHRRFPAMGAYLALRVASAPILVLLFLGQARHWFNDYCFMCYFFAFWAVYIASAILLYFICVEVFRSVLSAFTGLMRLGTLIFRWVAFVSVVVSFSTLKVPQYRVMVVPQIATGLMRPVSILELCLLTFLCLSMNSLRLSTRDIGFGISLGFGILSANDFVQSLLTTMYTSLTDPIQFVGEGVLLAGLGLWVVYFALPEPVRKPVMMPVNSTILRWNEIASALGHTGTQVAVQPTGGFFLTDVEKAVESALARNLENKK